MNYNFTDKQLELIYSNPEFAEIINKIINDYSLTTRKITHEFGNALTLINSSLQIIESSHPEVQDFKYWSSTMDDVHYLINLISEVSVFNNVEKLNLGTTDISIIAQSVLDSFKTTSLTKNINFIFNKKTFISQISGDETKLKQVFINLVKNAYEAIDINKPDSFILIDLNYNNNFITIEIKDNGCGIPKEHLNDIFTPMISYKSNGTGLGLPISKKIISAHNGTLTLTSEVGQYTSFIISLPV